MRYFCFILLLFLGFVLGCTKTTYVEGMLPVDSTTTTVTPTDTGFTSAANDGTFGLTNVWKASFASNIEKLYVKKEDAYYLGFQSGTSYTYLSVNSIGQTVFVTSNTVDAAGYNSKWVLELLSSPDVYRIRSYNTQNYLNVETGTWTTGVIQSGWLSAQWYIK